MRDSLRIPGSVAFYLLLGYAGLLLFSVNYTAVVPGLDSSWVFALNHFAHGPELFGRDLVFTYGPLGFLAVPQNIGSNLVLAAAVHIGVWCLLLYLLLLLWEAGSRAGALFFLSGWLNLFQPLVFLLLGLFVECGAASRTASTFEKAWADFNFMHCCRNCRSQFFD